MKDSVTGIAFLQTYGHVVGLDTAGIMHSTACGCLQTGRKTTHNQMRMHVPGQGLTNMQNKQTAPNAQNIAWVRSLLEGCSSSGPGLYEGRQDGGQNAPAQPRLHKVGLHVGLGPQHGRGLLRG